MNSATDKLQELTKGSDSQEYNVSIDRNYLQNKLGDEEACRLELLRIDVKQRKEQLDSTTQDREQRKEFANKIYMLLVGYLVVVFCILILVASGCLVLSDSVLLMILGTTTANVLAIFRFVARYLFK